MIIVIWFAMGWLAQYIQYRSHQTMKNKQEHQSFSAYTFKAWNFILTVSLGAFSLAIILVVELILWVSNKPTEKQ